MKKREEAFSYKVEAGNPGTLGVTVDGKRVNFAVAVPDQKMVSLLLYRDGSREVSASVPLSTDNTYGDIRSISIVGLPTTEYAYRYRIDGVDGLDPYARAFSKACFDGEAVEECRCKIPGETYDWEGDRPLLLPLESCILYGAHVRGLTMHQSCGVRAKGTFLGVKEMIPYLKELGINQLQLMPIYELAEETPYTNYWGYGRGYYFAPRADYAYGEDPIAELKELVKSLHRNGIELILEFYFPEGTRAGLITDVMRFWVQEYHIDGVQLSGAGLPVNDLVTDPMLSYTKFYGEGFEEAKIYPYGYAPKYRHIAECGSGFLETARRLLRGEEGQVEAFAGQVRRNGTGIGCVNRITEHNGYTLMDLVSYEEKHNEANGEDNRDGSNYNYSWNCGEEGTSDDPKVQELRLQQMKNALAMTFLSQGVPFLLSGDERGNSQKGNNNAYCQDNEIGWVCWDNQEMGEKFLAFTKELIAFRKKHPVLSQRRPLRGADDLGIGLPDISFHGKQAWYGEFEPQSRSLGVLYPGAYVERMTEGTKTDDILYVIYNLHHIPRAVALPPLPAQKKWYLSFHTGMKAWDGCPKAGQEIEIKEKKVIGVEPRSILVLIGK